MAYAYNTFEAWLQGHGLGSSLDGTGELKDGTSQAFFSSQYAAWLNDLINHYADAIRTTYGLAPDYQFAFALNPNDPDRIAGDLGPDRRAGRSIIRRHERLLVDQRRQDQPRHAHALLFQQL